MELILLGLVIAILGGGLLYDWYTQQSHVRAIADRWTTGGKSVEMPPIGLICHGDRPCIKSSNRIYGAVGVANGDFIFLGQRVSTCDLAIDADAIRWIGLRTEVNFSWNRRLETQTLVVHLETPQGWRVYTFTQGKPGRLMSRVARALSEATGHPINNMDELFEDYGPAPAVRLEQSEDGVWTLASNGVTDLAHLPANWDEIDSTLYLAPDRLLFDWTFAIPLANIQTVEALPHGTISTLSATDHDLLCVQYQPPGEAARLAGFLVDGAADWVSEIDQQRAEFAAGPAA